MSLKSGLTTKQKAVFLAHEKGHQLRRYSGMTYLDQQFREAIDWEHLTITPDELSVMKLLQDAPDLTSERAEEIIARYFNAEEIAERMSQLKNYFGFKGNESMTKQHLDYARQHYVKDVGFDNDMAIFLRAITPEKEARFLEVINTFGT